MAMMARFGAFWVVCILLQPRAWAEELAPAAEDWNAHVQSTYIWQHKPALTAPYGGPFSLSSGAENTYTFSLTGAFGKRLWQGGEFYLDPEVAQGVPLSNLTGMAGFYNGEITRASGANPILYRVRMFLRQTWGLGGEGQSVSSGINQLAGIQDDERVVLTAGFFPPLDIFDANRYSHDPRTQFLSWCNMAHCAFDYAADARGNTWGAALEYYRGDWVWRAGQFMQPLLANQLALDWKYFSHHGQNLEIEHAHQFAGQPGKLRLLMMRNTALMGSYADALADPAVMAAASATGQPATGMVRREGVKYGVGLNLEQAVTPDWGVFARTFWQDGRFETYAFTEAHRSFSLGASVQGTKWGRAADTVGVALMRNALSGIYRQYLAAGGLGYFIGDGRLNYADEQIAEAYYSLKVLKDTWLTADYQFMRNPAYNADRGPVSFAGVRLHWEH